MIRKNDLENRKKANEEVVVENIKEAINNYFASSFVEFRTEHKVSLGNLGYPLTDEIKKKVVAWCKKTGGWDAEFVYFGEGRMGEVLWDVVLR